MKKIIRAFMVEMIADSDPGKRWKSHWLEVTEMGPITTVPRWKACLPEFQMMCDAIMSDIQNVQGSGKKTMEAIRSVEIENSETKELGGNAWYTHIDRKKVRFEGLYDQGEGGEVGLLQFKTAVQTYLQFLSDPEHKEVEVELPEI